MWDDIRNIPMYWVGIFIGGLLLGALILGWVTILGPAFNRAEYNNYNNSPQHVNAVAQRFADDCQQEAATTDQTAKKAIEQDIYSLAATVNIDEMQMPSEVRSCVEKAIADVSGGH